MTMSNNNESGFSVTVNKDGEAKFHFIGNPSVIDILGLAAFASATVNKILNDQQGNLNAQIEK